MNIKVDEDIPPVVARWLQDVGYQANTVVGQKMGGWKDAALWQAVQSERHFFITADKGFSDIRLYKPGTHPGILLLRPDEDGVWPILDLLKMVLSQGNLIELEGTVSVATPRGLRVRRP